jgi:hypothetical protein
MEILPHVSILMNLGLPKLPSNDKIKRYWYFFYKLFQQLIIGPLCHIFDIVTSLFSTQFKFNHMFMQFDLTKIN